MEQPLPPVSQFSGHGTHSSRTPTDTSAPLSLLRTLQTFLHKSRHDHAMRRVRGPGGRFLTKAELNQYRKQLEAQDPEGATAPAPLPGTGKKNQVGGGSSACGGGRGTCREACLFVVLSQGLCAVWCGLLRVSFQTAWNRILDPLVLHAEYHSTCSFSFVDFWPDFARHPSGFSQVSCSLSHAEGCEEVSWCCVV